MRHSDPSKPCHIWDRRHKTAFKTLSHLGSPIPFFLQNPVTSGPQGFHAAFKTLSHLGVGRTPCLQNPVTSGVGRGLGPSKPCHIWGPAFPASFKTLSHLGSRSAVDLQNPVTSGFLACSMPSKPCHIWALSFRLCLQNPVTSGAGRPGRTFKTLSHLGDYHKSFVVHRKFGVKRM